MEINYVLLAITFASLSICFYTHFFMDLSKKYLYDPLTNTYNRYFLSKIEEYESIGEKFYVVFADIDFFKKINDTHGHDAGDYVLKLFSKKLNQSVKGKKDFVVRYGGEEFILFFNVKNTDIFTKDILKQRVEQVRKSIEDMSIEYDEKPIKITSSFGVSSDFDEILSKRIQKADTCLYEAKELGRNKVIID